MKNKFANDFAKKFISKAAYIIKSFIPLPVASRTDFTKEGHYTPLHPSQEGNPSLWQREVRRDFLNNIFILMHLLIKGSSRKSVGTFF